MIIVTNIREFHMQPAYFQRDEHVHNGREFEIERIADNDHGAPWDNDEWYKGLVSDWKSDKRPGERCLNKDGKSYRFFDWQGAIERGKKEDNVGGIDTFMRLTAQLRRVPTRKQCIEAQAQWMFDFLRGWCNDDWFYIGIVVRDVETGVEESCWGIESNCEDYIQEIISDLCEEAYLPSVRALIAGKAA